MLTLVPEENAEIAVQSLSFDNLTADEYKSTWASCAKFRINQIRNDCKNMHEALTLWPQYKQPNGSQLASKIHIKINIYYNL